MALIKFNIRNQIIMRGDAFKVVSDSRNYLHAQFDFLTDEWRGKTATAIFRNASDAYEVVLDQEDTCLVPWEVLQKDAGDFEVSVFAGDLITANTAKVQVYESGYSDDLESSTPPTPSVYAQIIERMDGVEDIVIEKTALAEEYAEQAEGSAASAAESAAAATQKAVEAAQSAETASDAVETAESAKTAAVEAAGASQTASQTAVNAAGNASASELSAAQSAQSASEDAGTASTAAQTATAKSTEAAQSASRAAASASEASTSATHAAGAATSASGYASDANASATAAAGSAQTASAKATQASASASSAEASANTASTANANAQAAKTAAETAQGAAEDAQEAAETARDAIQDSAAQIAQNTSDIDFLKDGLNKKVDITGIAPNAEQLIGDKYTEESVPYLFRKAGGSAEIGNREADMLVGGTVAWNQLMSLNDADWDKSNASFSVSEQTMTFSVESSSTNVLKFIYFGIETGHKYLFIASNITTENVGLFYGLWKSSTNNEYQERVNIPAGTSQGVSTIFNVTTGIYFRFQTATSSVIGDTVVIEKPQFFDLTQMFGTTIADYIYSLEQATAGAGVEFFRKLFPKDYYEYNAGELISVSGLSAHEMTGFNQIGYEVGIPTTPVVFDKSKATRIIKGQTYQYTFDGVSGQSTWRTAFRIFDLEGNLVRDMSFICSATGYPYFNTTFLTFLEGNDGTGTQRTYIFNNDCYVQFFNNKGTAINPCFHLVLSDAEEREYEPYKKHSYPLDDSLTLRGIPKLDANNNLYYDGDTYEHDGTVTRKYGIVDLGTLNWNYASANSLFNSSLPLGKLGNSTKGYLAICSNYQTNYDASFTGWSTFPDKSLSAGCQYDTPSYKNLIVKDSAYSDAATFKAAMSGVMLVYELATPTTETADAFAEYQTVDKYGTEEYVSTSIVPVGHVTKYYEDLRKKIENFDVQINGTSIVSDGVANIPIANIASKLGLVQVMGSGLAVSPNGQLVTQRSTDEEIKLGVNNNKPIVPSNQHGATFYGLAKAAGDTTQSQSSNSVGTYTEEAKIAIQKMLGIYEAPWELIREDTFTNETEANHIITVDGNGEEFELTDVLLILAVPTHSENTTIGDYGRVYFYNGNTNIKTLYFLNASSKVITANSIENTGVGQITQEGALVRSEVYLWNVRTTRASRIMLYGENEAKPDLTGAGNGISFLSSKLIVTSLKIGKITGQMRYRLYGKRKWQ